MKIYFVVNYPNNWPLNIPGVSVVSARNYLTDPAYSEDKSAKVFNLCRSYTYQSIGYYVSLLASARGHNPMPDINTIQDLKSQHVIRLLSEDIEEEITRALNPIQSDTFTLSIYFGKNIAKKYDKLSLRLFNLFRAPLLRAVFVKEKKGWQLQSIKTIAVNDIPESHFESVIQSAEDYFSGRKRHTRKRSTTRYDIAVLHNPEEDNAPSNERALKKFQRAAESVGLDMEMITRNDFHRLAEFDALFIRETTAVNHHTFRFAQRATAEGLVVMDDPDSILKCTNKVYLAELLARNHVPIPRTLIIHKKNIRQIKETLGLPCVLKQPDSAFSAGVKKIEDEETLDRMVNNMLDDSDLIVGQEFLPTEFDWRIGICDRRPLYACRYYMARKHWQIIKHSDDGTSNDEGKVDTLAISEVPEEVVKMALKAANLIGDGLYGVDVKLVDEKPYIIEVNDNPSIDSGYEDVVLKDALYREIMGVFLRRIEILKRGIK